MSKYIDADKLTKFEETLADIIVSSQGLCTYEACKDMAKREAPFLITSLQQEQPEVDLEKEYTEFVVSDPVYSKLVNGIVGKSIARHFYELGCGTQYQKDRGEFAKLKAKEWQDGYDEGYAKGLNARKEE